MSSSEPSGWESAAFVGDAALLSAIAILAAPLALVVGPSAAWLLHRRPIDRTSVVAGAIGLVGGVALAAAVGAVLAWLAGVPDFARGDMSGILLLGVLGVCFTLAILALLVDAVRDFAGPRLHRTVDIVRLAAIGLLVVAGAGVTVIQRARPETEMGDAAVFGIVFGLAGGIVALVWNLVYARMSRSRVAGTSASQGGEA